MKDPKVSVIIPYLNIYELKLCVKSIEKQKYKNKEIIYGTEESEGFKKRKSIGFMRNYLAKKAKGDILIFLDSDAEFVSDYEINKIIKLFNDLEKNKVSIAAITGLQVAPKEKKSILSWLIGLDYEENIKSIGEGIVNFGASTIIAIKSKVFWDVNGFIDASIGEDLNFSQRLNEKNYKIYHTNKVKIYHYTASSLLSYLRKQFFYAWYRVYRFKKFSYITDSYTKISIIIQSALFLPLLISILIHNIFYPFLTILIFLLIFFWDSPQALTFFRKTKNLEVFLFLPLSFIRSFVRALATVKGLWDFYIRNKQIKV
jgi:glycosyltransferase involved in cell wall biosynthesis